MHSPYLLIGLAAIAVSASEPGAAAGALEESPNGDAARPSEWSVGNLVAHLFEGSSNTHPASTFETARPDHPYEHGHPRPPKVGNGGAHTGHEPEWQSGAHTGRGSEWGFGAHATHHSEWSASSASIQPIETTTTSYEAPAYDATVSNYPSETAVTYQTGWITSTRVAQSGEASTRHVTTTVPEASASMTASPSTVVDASAFNPPSSATGAEFSTTAPVQPSVSVFEAHESLYIMPNHGTDMYAKDTAPQAWTTPPCTTTVTSVTQTPSCITPTYERNYAATATSTVSPAPTSNASKLFSRFFGPKMNLAQREPEPAAGPKFERRALTLQPGEGFIPAGREEPNPVRQYAMGIGAGNFETAVKDSVTADLSTLGVTALWIKLESKGNPYVTYYLNNGHGDPLIALANEAVASAANSAGLGAAGSAVTTAVGAVATAVDGVADGAGQLVGAAVSTAAPAPPPVGDAGYALLSMLGQVNSKTYVLPTGYGGATGTTAKLTAASTTASFASKHTSASRKSVRSTAVSSASRAASKSSVKATASAATTLKTSTSAKAASAKSTIIKAASVISTSTKATSTILTKISKAISTSSKK